MDLHIAEVLELEGAKQQSYEVQPLNITIEKNKYPRLVIRLNVVKFVFKDMYLDCLDGYKYTSNKRGNNEKDCGVHSRAAVNDIFACPCGGYIRRRR